MQSERKTLVAELRAAKQAILARDGDRDEDNHSDLSVEQSCLVASLCGRVADYFDPHSDQSETESSVINLEPHDVREARRILAKPVRDPMAETSMEAMLAGAVVRYFEKAR